ncbi:hypothetical protein NPIL_595751 [Nephila pilipes]|uniref:Uncharacterized protein n=1 Tax=Nephila pilipes TaxID=299642 RepID=A0A8X6UGK9_NEPPI|nr:hypothetical protein NPIL_595751 [Nephila pilipes]
MGYSVGVYIERSRSILPHRDSMGTHTYNGDRSYAPPPPIEALMELNSDLVLSQGEKWSLHPWVAHDFSASGALRK